MAKLWRTLFWHFSEIVEFHYYARHSIINNEFQSKIQHHLQQLYFFTERFIGIFISYDEVRAKEEYDEKYEMRFSTF